jgi:glycosyltransferase involved in cell wall biosynthesis
MPLPERDGGGLRSRLSPELKLTLKRLFVGTVGAVVEVAARAVNFAARVRESAERHGLDWRRAWDVPPARRAAPPAPLAASDFLFLTETLAGRAPRPDPDRAVNVSVVINVFDEVEATFQCLRSLLREVDFSDAEVIVVDDASTYETARVLAHFEGFVRVLTNETREGAAGARNRGASVARGEFIVFLDSAASVQAGWLRNLLETAERDARVGAVGSLLLDAGGRIREAGGVVWRDGEVFPYGRGKSPDDRRFTFAREVDYCSGASLLVRRELFERLGGFDRRDAPGREDADLCFGLRALGHKVVYQPLSRVVLNEDDGPETSRAAGGERFRAKWRETLEREHFPRDPRLGERAANRIGGPHVFVFDDHIPTPDRDAGSARMAFILRALREWSRPVFVSLGKQTQPAYERLLWKEGVETASVVDFPRLLREREFHAAVLSRPSVAEMLLKPLRRAGPRLRIVYDMVDAHFVRLGRESALTGDAGAAREAARYQRVEAELARAADLVWYASTVDKEAVERLAPGVRGAVVPTIHRLRPPGLPFDEREHLIFVGNFVHRPNADAVNFFVREILPLVRVEIPGVRLLLVGDNAPPDVAAHASEEVRLLGYVPDLDPLMARARVFVAPIRFGAGINGKIGEALAYGLPVVTTSVGAGGMGFADGEQALVADDPREFAAAVARAYRDAELWRRLSERGRRHIEQNFTPEVVSRIINDSIRGKNF